MKLSSTAYLLDSVASRSVL